MYRKNRPYRKFRGQYGHTNWSQWHQNKRSALSQRFGGIDDDVIEAFLSLDAERLYKFFDAYERKHGLKARKYARDTYHKWKEGKTQISAQTAERLLEILPPFLSLEVKYELIRKLRDRCRRKEVYSFTVDTLGWESTVIPIVESLIGRSERAALPQELTSRLSWLSSGDAAVTQQLLAESEKRSALISAAYLNREFDNIARLLGTKGKKQVAHVVELPYGTINLTVVRSAAMDDESKDLVRRPPEEPLTVGSTGNLLEDAIKNLTPEQRRQISKKATEEALRLQVAAHEAEKRHDHASRDVEEFIDNVHRLDTRASDHTTFEAQGEFRGASGVTSVKVKRDTARNWLFVAVALLVVLIFVLFARR
jgi:hypothetical protein